VAQGTHAELLATEPRYAELMGGVVGSGPAERGVAGSGPAERGAEPEPEDTDSVQAAAR